VLHRPIFNNEKATIADAAPRAKLLAQDGFGSFSFGRLLVKFIGTYAEHDRIDPEWRARGDSNSSRHRFVVLGHTSVRGAAQHSAAATGAGFL
jgi:hypothetical protein